MDEKPERAGVAGHATHCTNEVEHDPMPVMNEERRQHDARVIIAAITIVIRWMPSTRRGDAFERSQVEGWRSRAGMGGYLGLVANSITVVFTGEMGSTG